MQVQLNAQQNSQGGNYQNKMQQELNAIMDMHSNLMAGSVGAHLPPKPPLVPTKGMKASAELALGQQNSAPEPISELEPSAQYRLPRGIQNKKDTQGILKNSNHKPKIQSGEFNQRDNQLFTLYSGSDLQDRPQMQNLGGGPSSYFESYHNAQGRNPAQQAAHPISTGFTQSEYSDAGGAGAAYDLPAGVTRANQYQPRPPPGNRGSSPLSGHKHSIQSSAVDIRVSNARKPAHHGNAAYQHQNSSPVKSNASSPFKSKPTGGLQQPVHAKKPQRPGHELARKTGEQMLTGHNLKHLDYVTQGAKKPMKSEDQGQSRGDMRSQITYNPYKMKDFKKIQQGVGKEPARGLGSNVGNQEWNKAQDARDKVKGYSDKLREQNRMFGLVNADKKYGESHDLGKKVLKAEKPKAVVEVQPSFASQVQALQKNPIPAQRKYMPPPTADFEVDSGDGPRQKLTMANLENLPQDPPSISELLSFKDDIGSRYDTRDQKRSSYLESIKSNQIKPKKVPLSPINQQKLEHKKKKEASSRDKALMFAKTKIPKPKMMAQSSSNDLQTDIMKHSPLKEKYAALDQKHDLY